MYEYIVGAVTELTPTYAVIETGGVGYYMQISLQTFSKLEGVDAAQLYVHFVVREDAQLLYGFSDRLERELFRHLIGVSGVGGNTARMVLSTYTPQELQGIIATGNVTLLKNVKGLGVKTAQKIILDLSGKLTDLDDIQPGKSGGKGGDPIFDEALSALKMLGFAKGVSEKALKAVATEHPDATTEELVRMSLKKL